MEEQKNKRGRPPAGRKKRVFQVNENLSLRIDEIAREYQLSYSDVVNLMLRAAETGCPLPWRL